MIEYNNVFCYISGYSSGRYDHHQANAKQNFKNVVTCSTQNVRLYGIQLTSMSIFVSSLKLSISSDTF